MKIGCFELEAAGIAVTILIVIIGYEPLSLAALCVWSGVGIYRLAQKVGRKW